MSCRSGFLKTSVAVMLAAALLTSVHTLAQEPAAPPEDASPAMRHAQVIAHGVAVMPAEEVGWRLTVIRAVTPHRAVAKKRAAGFILADRGVIGVADDRGTLLARVAPGEALWIEPDTPRAVVSLAGKPIAIRHRTPARRGSPR